MIGFKKCVTATYGIIYYYKRTPYTGVLLVDVIARYLQGSKRAVKRWAFLPIGNAGSFVMYFDNGASIKDILAQGGKGITTMEARGRV